jgi:hypothetical protein
MVKIFSTGANPTFAGEDLNNQLNEWLKTLDYNVDITNIHSNSNKFGWMLIIQYNKKT